MIAEQAPEQRTAVGLLAALYAWEAAALALAMAFYRFSNRLGSLTVRQHAWIVAPAAVLLASLAYIVRCRLASRRSAHPWFGYTLALNLVPATILLVVAEAAVRLLSVHTPLDVSVAGTVLLPKSWDQVRARTAEVLKDAQSNSSYLVSDTLLGWTIGPSRRSSDGLYLSSAEGIRSGRQGVAYAGRRARYRIATVGDSYTFGLEVPFESSWGNKLERVLGHEFEVLNFGVGGYGVDQAYLRYQRDVRPWRPALVIFGLIGHDLYRSLSVYSFVTFPEWGSPFSKPRFVVRDGKPKLLNARVISPAEILATPSVEQLPFIGYDPGYKAAEWQWHWYDASRLLRFVLSRFPRWPLPDTAQDQDKDPVHLNSALVLGFVQQAAAQGSVPLVVYFPSRGDFNGQDRSAARRVLATVRSSGVRLVDLTACIGAVGEVEAFIPDHSHYSAEGNAAVAGCLSSVVEREMHGRLQ